MQAALSGLFKAAIVAAILFLTDYLNDWLKARKKARAHPLEQDADRNRQIGEILSTIREHYRAKRAYVSRFHNGGQFLGGGGVYRVTRTYESCEPGTTSEMDNFRDVISTTMVDELELIMEEGAGWRAVSELQKTHFRMQCSRGGAQAIARQAIKKEGHVIAVLGVDFATDERPANLKKLEEEAWRIGQLLP